MGQTFREQVREYLLKAYPALWIQTSEYERVLPELAGIAGDVRLKQFEWNILDGVCERTKTGRSPLNDETKDPLMALEWIRKKGMPERGMIVFKDFHFHISGTEIIEAVRQLVEVCKQSNRFMVFLAPVAEIPREIEKLVVLVEHKLPTREELELVLTETLDFAKSTIKEMKPDEIHSITESARGLTSFEAEQAFALSYHPEDGFSRDVIQTQKKQILAKSQILEYYEVSQTLSDIGGLDAMKKWLAQRRTGFSEKARKYGLPIPKGILTVGVPGCGKSLTAKATAREWQLPLLRLDVGRVFAGLVGASEANMRSAIRVAEAMAPVILWVDEMEKAFAGIASSGSTDSGVTARVFGTFLTWMQEHTDPVFVFATANNVKQLPPELLRKGRFDELFFIDLPSPQEREAIWQIHLKKVGREPKKFDLKDLVERSHDFTGAEIEAALHDGMFTAFARGDEVTDFHIMNALQRTNPLAKTMAEVVSDGRNWAKTRARLASTPEEEKHSGRKSLDV